MFTRNVGNMSLIFRWRALKVVEVAVQLESNRNYSCITQPIQPLQTKPHLLWLVQTLMCNSFSEEKNLWDNYRFATIFFAKMSAGKGGRLTRAMYIYKTFSDTMQPLLSPTGCTLSLTAWKSPLPSLRCTTRSWSQTGRAGSTVMPVKSERPV